MSSVFSTTRRPSGCVVILGTGGTIAGTGNDPARPRAYRAAQLSVDELVAGVPELGPVQAMLRCEQVAQIDSKDMSWSVWQALGEALTRYLSDPEVLGVVITHGSDTLEETAALLHWLAPQGKPIVLTAAMRPATAPDADGPRNLRDAVAVVLHAHRAGQAGVVAVLDGHVWSARDVRKAHSHAVAAFDGGGAAPLLASVDALDMAGAQPAMAPWPAGPALGLAVLARQPARVPLLMSHGGLEADWIEAGLRAGGMRPDGVLVAGTGHGTVHAALEGVLRGLHAEGVVIWRSSRVGRGGVCPQAEDAWPATGHWTAAQARLGLQLHLMGLPLRLDAPADASLA